MYEIAENLREALLIFKLATDVMIFSVCTATGKRATLNPKLALSLFQVFLKNNTFKETFLIHIILFLTSAFKLTLLRKLYDQIMSVFVE